jgi:aminopeptidase N
MRIRTMLFLIAACGSAAAAGIDDDSYGAGACLHARMPAEGARAALGFDPRTGRNLRAYPPDRVVDFRHMKLAIDIPDMNVPRAHAVQTLTLSAISAPVAALTLDAKLLAVESVAAAGHRVKFSSDTRTLRVEFEPPLEAGAETELVTAYTINDPPQGLFWTPESPAWPGRAAQIHTQGESDTNSYWFPCHDFPNEKLTTELSVTVPAGYIVSSNGREAEHRTDRGRELWHFVQDKPHANYLVSLVVGKFDVVDVAAGGKGAVPMPVYVPLGRGRDVVATYGRTPEMVELFGKLVHQPYAWDKYAQVIVWNFGAGGMENTSATTMYDTAILSKDALDDGDLEGLISHELAHQWFGDLITCNSWEHIWLNEGFATYFSQLWSEHSRGRDAYLAGILGDFDAVRRGDHADAPFQAPMCRKTYSDPGETFGGPASPYPKGASILHMLRSRLGDDLFFRGLSLYVDRYKFKTAETGDLRRCMEEVSGDSLEQFFTQWCFRPGMPDLDIGIDWDAGASELVVSVQQMQKIDGDNPAFEFDLPISFADEASPDSGRTRERGVVKRAAAAAAGPRVHTIAVRGQKATARIKLDREPSMVAVDPELHVLCRPTIHQPLNRWLAQLDRGPSLPARIQAARELGKAATTPGAMALAAVAQDPEEPEQLRAEALHALAAMKDAATLAQIASGTVQPSGVRLALVEAVASVAHDIGQGPQAAGLKAVLVDHAASDTSFRCRAVALRALGRLKATDQLKLILAAAETPSQHDRVRQGALEALADLDAPGTLATAVRFAMPGTLNRTRPVAISAVAALAPQDPESAYRALVMLLTDRERRASQAAGEALVRLGDARAVGEFEKLADTAADPADQKRLRGWAAELKAKAAAAEGAPAPKG